ncbi:hypothetical protein OXT66_07845 [Lentilactobacillus senioris]|uniref:hypothetical protein n=1 Tax=Lentilactobacillus senioris TaxID=931534 RepID=UPI00227F23CD|nr:hypothetical protein [Lentilactobacillus senioris]MCY9807444.1 hypothetical protein [Lentilactobacillus senioris]
MAQYYVQLDEKRYIAKVQSELSSTDKVADFIHIYVPTQFDEVFGETWDKWGINELGTPIHGWLPPITRKDFSDQVDDLNGKLATANQTIKDQAKKIDGQQQTIATQGTSIDTLTTDNTTLKKMAAGLTMQVAQLQAAVTPAETPKEGE